MYMLNIVNINASQRLYFPRQCHYLLPFLQEQGFILISEQKKYLTCFKKLFFVFFNVFKNIIIKISPKI